MAQVVENKSGTWVQDPMTASWRRVTPEEQAEIGKSGLQVFGESFANNFQQFGNLLQLGASTMMMSTQAQDALAQDAMKGLSKRGKEQAMRGRLNPQATAGGTVAAVIGDPLNFLGPGIVRKTGEGIAGAQAKRAAIKEAKAKAAEAARQAEAAQAAEAATAQAARQATSTEAAETVVERFTPKAFNKILDSAFGPGQLSPQQAQLIPVADELGFKFLPGQRTGGRQFLDGLDSHPILRLTFADELEHNAQLMQQLLIDGLGVADSITPATFSKNIHRISRTKLGAEFDKVAKAVDESGQGIALDADSIATIGEIPANLSASQRRIIKLDNMTGAQAMEVRSRLNKKATDLYSNAEQTGGDDLMRVVEALDDRIAEVIDPAISEAWRSTRQRWRLRIATKKPGVITDDGVSLKKLHSNIEKSFEREFGEQLLPDDEFKRLNPDIARLMDFTRVARNFASNVPDSGTPGRQFAAKIFSPKGWQEIATAQAIGGLIKATAK